jgi:hypothetical protein
MVVADHLQLHLASIVLGEGLHQQREALRGVDAIELIGVAVQHEQQAPAALPRS